MISREQVEHIAKLAHIEISANETEKFQKELSAILDYFDVLKPLNTDDIEPMIHAAAEQNIVREDTARATEKSVIEALLHDAPAKQDGFIKVKSILKQS